jgi:hypothetical protein
MPISTIGQNGLNAPITLTSPVINNITSASATNLTLQSAGTTAVTVDTSQNVGINQSSPTVISTAKQVAIKAGTNGDSLFVAQNSNSLTTFFAGYYGVTAGPNIPALGSYSNDPVGFFTNNTERMRISTAGYVTNPYQVAVAAYSNTSQSIADGSAVVIALNAIRYNIGSAFSTSTYLFTAPIAGYYMCTGIVSWTGTFSAARQFCMIYKNGAQDNGFGVQIPRTSSFDTGVSCSGILYLAAGDTVSLAGYQSSGSSQTILGNGNQTWTNLTIRLLG